MMSIDRHFCVTAYVRDPETGRFLLMKHKKLGKWLPTGGHIEANETPDSAAKRECLEETGIHIELIGETPEFSGGLVTPLSIQLNVISPDEHEHMDLIYAARPLKGQMAKNGESDDLGWFTPEEIKNLNTFASIPYWVSRVEGLA
jgi:8-oxo-dGTP diphosphatase